MNPTEASQTFGQTTAEIPDQAGPPDVEQLPAGGARRIAPLHIALGGVLVVAMAAGAGYLLMSRGTGDEAASAHPTAQSAAASAEASASVAGPATAAPTRNPFAVLAGTTAAATSAAPVVASTVTSTATTTQQVSVTVSSTITTTATVKATYAFVSGWDGADPTKVLLVVNNYGAALLAEGDEAHGVTYDHQDDTDADCAWVMPSSATSPSKVCTGQGIKLG
jgi:hypothetical protein